MAIKAPLPGSGPADGGEGLTTGLTTGLTLEEVGALLGRDAAALSAAAAEAHVPIPGRQVSLAAYFRLLRWLAPQAGRETFDLSSRPTLHGTKELVYGRASAERTVEAALRTVAETYNLVHGGAFNRVEAAHGRLAFVIHDDGYPYVHADDPKLWFVLEATLIGLHAAVCELAGRDVTGFLRRVGTRRPGRGGPGAEALAFWPAPVRFGGDAYSLAYDAAAGALPVTAAFRHADHALAVHTRILALVERASPDATCAGRVARALRDGFRGQAAVAARLGVSVATLRRRLGEEATGFRTLRDAHLSELARRRIALAPGLDDLAADLGFSDARAFRRAFKSWTGETPGAYRDRLAAKPD